MGDKKLNLGSGHVHLPPSEGWVNLDGNPDTGCDVAAFVPPIPLGDQTFDHILASHFIEHVEDTIHLFNECWRVLKPGGTMKIFVPYALSHGAFQDPTHVKFFVPESFMYYTEQMAYLKYGIKVWSSADARLDSQVIEVDMVK